MSRKEYNSSISMIRLLAMMLIISCHICQYYDSEWAWWLNIGVQIFFILSGFLYGGKEIKEPIKWLGRQFKKILIRYYIFLLIAIGLYIIFAPNILSIGSIISSFFCVGVIKGIGHLWFVGYILFCYLITPYLSLLSSYLDKININRSIFIVLSLICICSVIGVLTHSYFRPGRIMCYIAGFFISYFYKRAGGGKIYLRMSITIFCIGRTHKYCFLLHEIFQRIANEWNTIKYYRLFTFIPWTIYYSRIDDNFKKYQRYLHLEDI